MESWKNNIMLSDRYTNGEWVSENRSSLISLAVKKLNIDSDKILDLGCGKGIYSKDLLQIFSKGSLLIGVDISKENVKAAKAKLSNKKAEFILADGHFLPFMDKCLDAVISKDLLHHASNPTQVLKEVIRISTGPSVVIEANKSNPIMILNEKYGHHHLTSKQLKFLAKNSGALDFDTFTSYDYPFTLRLPSANPIASIWNLSASLLLVSCNGVPLMTKFFSQVFRLLVHSYNGLTLNP